MKKLQKNEKDKYWRDQITRWQQSGLLYVLHQLSDDGVSRILNSGQIVDVD